MRTKNNLNRLSLFIKLIICTLSGQAQQTFPVNLETVLKLSGANNLTVKEYQLKYKLAIADQAKAKEWWLPTLYAGATTHYLTGSAMNTDGHIFTGIKQTNAWAGLVINMDIDFGKGFYQVLAAKQKAQAIQFYSLAGKNKTILQAVSNYFDLQSSQLKYTFLQQLVMQSDTLTQQIKIQVDAGIRYQSEYLLSKSNYNHLKISSLQAKMDWQKSSGMLANLLNLDKNTRLISADTVLVPIQFSKQQLDTTGFKTRPEYSGLTAELQSLQTSKKTVNQGLLLPTLRLGLDNGAFGGYTTQLNNTYQYNASFLWKLPFGRLTYKGDIKRYNAQIDLQHNAIDQFKNQYQEEITMANTGLELASQQMEIAKQALQISTEAMEQSIERQKLQTAKPFEVFQAQQFLLQAQVDYLNTVSSYNKAQFELKVAKGELL
jgi:outer membrane protein TolC